jgi:hypothetical protein
MDAHGQSGGGPGLLRGVARTSFGPWGGVARLRREVGGVELRELLLELAAEALAELSLPREKGIDALLDGGSLRARLLHLGGEPFPRLGLQVLVLLGSRLAQLLRLTLGVGEDSVGLVLRVGDGAFRRLLRGDQGALQRGLRLARLPEALVGPTEPLGELLDRRVGGLHLIGELVQQVIDLGDRVATDALLEVVADDLLGSQCHPSPST